MKLIELFHLRSKLLQDFEEDFSKMEFKSDDEMMKYYSAFQDGMAHFFVHSMIHIMDHSEQTGEDKAA